MPLSLYLGTSPDAGKLLSIYLGLLLLLGAFAAIGLYLSSLTSNQTVAAISTFGVLLMLWIIDWIGNSAGEGQSVLAYLSLLEHHQAMLEGVFNTGDVAYYLLLIAGFLGLAIRQLDRERLL
jgi:ABC-2 type transport system permease protein